MTWEKYLEKKMVVHKGDVIKITDPCYDADTETSTCTLPEGVYSCYYDLVDQGVWGMRVAGCALLLEGEGEYNLCDYSYMDRAGSTGVDAGLAGFFINKPDYDDAGWDEFCRNLEKMDKEWKEKDHEHNRQAYHTDEGFFTNSGHGDGEYDAYYIHDTLTNGKIGVLLKFIPSEYEDEEDEEDEDYYEDEEEDD